MKRPLIISIILFSSISTFAQDEDFRLPDSLMVQLKGNRDSDITRLKILSEVIDCYLDDFQIANCYDYIIELNEIAQECNSLYYNALSEYYIGGYNCDCENYRNALKCFDNALKIIQTLRKTKENQMLLAKIYLGKSYCYMSFSMYYDAMEMIQKGLDITCENPEFTKLEIGLETNKGAILYNLSDYEEAFDLFKEAISKSKRTNSNRFNLYRDIGKYYRQYGNQTTALQYYDSARLNTRSITDSAIIINDLGSIYLERGDFDKAESLFTTSLEMVCSSNLSATMAAYEGLSAVSWQKGDFRKANEYIDDAIKYSRIVNDFSSTVRLYWKKAEILRNMELFKESLILIDTCLVITDSLNELIKFDEIKVAETRMQLQLLEKQSEFERSISKQRQRVVVTISIVVVLLIAVAFIVYYYEKKRKEKAIKDELDLRNREITSKTMTQIHTNELLSEMIEKLQEMIKVDLDNEKLGNLIKDLEIMKNESSSKDFDYYFVQVHPDFYKNLLSDFPQLTPNELRLCAYIKANLNIKDVANITNVSAESVKSARKRLRRSLNLVGDSVSLVQFLSKY